LHGRGDLFRLVAQILFDVAANHGDTGIGAIGGFDRLPRQFRHRCKFLVLRALEIFELLLQLGDIPLQFEDFLAGAGRGRRHGK